VPLEAPIGMTGLGEPRAARRAALLAVAVGLAVRVAAAIVMGLSLHWSDERRYMAYAIRVARGEWLGPHIFAFYPPGQYYTMGLLFHLTGASLAVARALEVAVSTASIWLLFRLVRRVSRGTAVLAAWGLALYPLVVYTSGTLYPQTLAIFYLLCFLNLLADHVERPSAARLPAAGLFLGLTALTVPTMLTMTPVVAAWLWWVRRFRWRALLEVAALACCCALTLAPWVARNLIVEKRFIPVATIGSQILFFANNPNADPDCKDIAILERVYTPEIKAEIARTGDENGVYFRHTVDFIRTQPGRFAWMYLRRLQHFYDFAPQTFTRTSHNGPLARMVVTVTSAPVLLLALFGAWGWARRSRMAALWVALPLAWGLPHAMFGVTIRYRLTMEPLIIAAAAWTVWRYVLRAERAGQGPDPAAPVPPA
jgi:4-amino-4-deoxy-L-arabinose transferase-like glycosyltransferase